MNFTSARQLKDWIKNLSAKKGIEANTVLHSYMMERLMERISLSQYRENVILKGGFLIASMVGIDRRNTMDIDTTIKGVSLNRNAIEDMLNEILSIDAGDNIIFEIKDIRNIHDISEYDDFRVSLRASFHTMRVEMKIDITTGDTIIPSEVEYHNKLMFEERTIPVMAYNLYTILAEKIETILSRNVSNTRGRDFYDVYILISLKMESLSKDELLRAINIKSQDRNSTLFIENHAKHIKDITSSPEIGKVWDNYTKNYPYATGIALSDILALVAWVFE